MSQEETISREDVLQVAKSLKMEEPSEKIIQEIIDEYPSEADNDPSATWNLIVENQLYNKMS